MPLDLSAELAAPGAIPWVVTEHFAVGAYRPPPGSVPLKPAMTETNYCFGISDAVGEVEVEGEGSAAVGPDTIRFHNVGDRMYARSWPETTISAAWVLLSEESVEAALSDAGVSGVPSSRPFARSFLPGRLAELAEVRRYFRRAERGSSAVWAEECALALLVRLLPTADQSLRPGEPTARQRRLVRDADAWIGSNFAQQCSLNALARILGVTAPYLARSYRAVTGQSMHARLTGLRLATAMSRLADSERDLTGMALDLGFASHSHFTHSFRKEFGITPREARARLTPRGCRAS